MFVNICSNGIVISWCGLMKHSVTCIPTGVSPVKSLAWKGESLVDWAAGGAVYGPRFQHQHKIDDRFDCASVSASGRFIAVYDRYGTESVVYKDGIECRRLTRAAYHAADYDYPLCFIAMPNGREAVAHCPKDYNKIVIEDAETGEDLGYGLEGIEEDFFHSRLAYDIDSGWLMSAGWIWHPVDSLRLFNLRSEETPNSVDLVEMNNISSAVFLGDGHLAMAVSMYDNGFFDEGDEYLPYGSLCVFSMDNHSLVDCIELKRELGTIHYLGNNRILCLYEHPFVVDMKTRDIVTELHGIQCSSRCSSINPRSKEPAVAVDPGNNRFAIVGPDQIQVMSLGR